VTIRNSNMAFLAELFKGKPNAPERVLTDTVIPLFDGDDTRPNRSIAPEFTMKFDEVLDAEKISGALWKLIDRPGWKKLGARLRLNVHLYTASISVRILTLFTGQRQTRIPHPRAIHKGTPAYQLYPHH
jgi:hypothetical protein